MSEFKDAVVRTVTINVKATDRTKSKGDKEMSEPIMFTIEPETSQLWAISYKERTVVVRIADAALAESFALQAALSQVLSKMEFVPAISFEVVTN